MVWNNWISKEKISVSIAGTGLMWFHETSLFFAIYPQTNQFNNIHLRLSLDPLKLMGVLLVTLMRTWWGLIYCIQEVGPSWKQSGKSEKGTKNLCNWTLSRVLQRTYWSYYFVVAKPSFFSFHSSFLSYLFSVAPYLSCHCYVLVMIEFSFPTL